MALDVGGAERGNPEQALKGAGGSSGKGREQGSPNKEGAFGHGPSLHPAAGSKIVNKISPPLAQAGAKPDPRRLPRLIPCNLPRLPNNCFT